MSDGFWKRICGLAGSALTRERWRAELAGADPLLEGCLEKTGRPVQHTKSDDCGSNHKVVPDEGGDGFISVCGVEGGCESRPMTSDEARAWILSGKALVELVGRALPVTAKVRAIGSHGLWESGTVWLRSGVKKTLCVAIVGKPAGLEVCLADLFDQGLRDFVLLMPDSQWCGTALAARLGVVGGEAYGLDEFVEIRDGKIGRGALAEKTLAEGPGRRRSIFAGNTTYTGVPLADIVGDLQEWERTTKEECVFLREKQVALQKAQTEVPQETYDQKFEADMIEWERKTRERKMSPELAEYTRPFLAKYSDILGFIVTIVANHERFAMEFGRLVRELPRGVKASHAEALRQILVKCDSLNDQCRDFREDYVIRGPWIEVATAVYNEVLEAHGDYLDLGNVALRLDALVGSTMEMPGAVSGSAVARGTGDAGAVAANGWSGLQVGEVFEAREMLWNGTSFAIEAPAACYKGYDLDNQSLEDYFPELREDWDTYIKEVPFDEVENLRILRLVGYEKTLSIHVLLKGSVVEYPERIESSGDDDGWHAGGALLVGGQKVPIKGIRVEPTDPKFQAQIAACRRARGSGRPGQKGAEGGPEATKVSGPGASTTRRKAGDECTLRERGMKERKQGRVTRKIRKWAIRFKGDEFDLPDNMGTEYLVFLLTHPRKELRADELVTALNGGHAGNVKVAEVEDFTADDEGNASAGMRAVPDSGDERVTKKTIQDLTKRAKELKQMIAEGERDPGQAHDVEEWNEELEKINEYLVHNTKLHGDTVVSRNFETGAYRKQANLISKHMNGVLECIKQHDEELAKYLSDKGVLMFGSRNLYTGADGVVWGRI